MHKSFLFCLFTTYNFKILYNEKNLIDCRVYVFDFTFAGTIENEHLTTKIQLTEDVGCSYATQYTWYRAVIKRVFSMEGPATEVTYVLDRVCTTCYSIGGGSTTSTTTCVNY